MIKNLTSGEREASVIILVLVAIAGLAMAALGRADPLGTQGWIVVDCR